MTQHESYTCVLKGMGENGTDYTYNASLGVWVRSQRQSKIGTKGYTKLAPDRESLLQKLVDEGMY